MGEKHHNWHDRYRRAHPTEWHGRPEIGSGTKLWQCIECVDLRHKLPSLKKLPAFGLLGFACDKGIRRNQGRPGAEEGPYAMREALSNIALHITRPASFYDFGDIICHDGMLANGQEALAQVVTMLIQHGISPILMGGGHEIAWGHYQGLTRAFPDTSPSIINIDAHFNLKPLHKKKASSGTPFRQIAMLCEKSDKEFDYSCIGIQPFSNTPELFSEAKKRNVEYITAEQVHFHTGKSYQAILNKVGTKQDPLYLSLDLHAFASSFAPGVSSPQPMGLFPWQVVPLLEAIASMDKVITFDVAELSPPLDHDGMTAR
ncbi:formimidoylglutamase, partial [Simkania negevensis]|nr:formimidoylglutamase [Simkania negevensis]